MGPKGQPDTKTNWSTDLRPSDKLDSKETTRTAAHGTKTSNQDMKCITITGIEYQHTANPSLEYSPLLHIADTPDPQHVCTIKVAITNKTNKLHGLSPPLVGEVTANFCGQRVPRGQRDRSLRSSSRFSRQEPLLFYQVAPQLYSRG
jgi:hypothetical protein